MGGGGGGVQSNGTVTAIMHERITGVGVGGGRRGVEGLYLTLQSTHA